MSAHLTKSCRVYELFIFFYIYLDYMAILIKLHYYLVVCNICNLVTVT